MPLTWLDYFVRRIVKEAPPKLQEKCQNPRELANVCTMQVMQQYVRDGMEKPGKAGEEARAHAVLCTAVLPFLNPRLSQGLDLLRKRLTVPNEDAQAAMTRCAGLQITARLAADLGGAEPPRGTGALCWPLMRERVWYVDCPHTAVRLGRQHQVRAVFSYPISGALKIVACITAPGSDKLDALLAWSCDEQWQIVEAHGGVEGPGETGEALSRTEVARQVTDLLRLVHLYHATGGDGPALPYVAPEHLATLPGKKRFARMQYESIFRLVSLDSPPDRFGRSTGPRDDDEPGWTLRTRSHVRGHFRWQAHGPRWSERRLIWIDEHWRGPEDGDVQVDLTKLRGKPGGAPLS